MYENKQKDSIRDKKEMYVEELKEMPRVQKAGSICQAKKCT